MIYDKRDGPFRLEVERIKTFGPSRGTDLAGMRWSKRPLLVFAPRADDARLERQLADVRASRAEFDERDMALIVVLAEVGSSGGDAAVAPREAAALRRRFGIDSQDFAIRLVGKDGGIKRKGAEPVPMSAIYAQIDEMPMRRAEAAERRR